VHGADAGQEQRRHLRAFDDTGDGLDPLQVGVRAEAVVEAAALQPVAMRDFDRVNDTLRSTLTRPVFDSAVQSRTFRVAMSDIGERIFLPRLADHLARSAPNVVIEAVSPRLEQLHEGLSSGQIDLAVGFFGTLSKQVHHRRLFRERFVYLARQGHPAVKGKLTREQLRGLAHVVGGPEGMQHAAAAEKVLSGARVKARVALRVHSLLCVGPVVAGSDLVGLVPGNLGAMVASHMPLQLVDPPVQFPGFDVTMVWHDRFHREPAIEWLRSVFVSLFDGLKLSGRGLPPA
jgi:DNA-binding transcriptional LysR family regulator